MDRSFFNDIDLEILFNINCYSMNYFAYENAKYATYKIKGLVETRSCRFQ